MHSESFWHPNPRKRANSRIWAILAAIALLLTLWAGLAWAHIAGHPEWNDVLGASTNAQGTSCCGVGDAKLLDFDEWRETKSGYEVYLYGRWEPIEKWKITENMVNPTGKAVVWYTVYEGGLHIYCFKPLNTF